MAAATTVRHRKSGDSASSVLDPVDRLSILPDPILCHILSFLPTTKDAIKTATLSKSWRFRWTLVPALVFSSFGEDFLEDWSPRDWSPNDFAQSVDKTLILHSAPAITEFIISCPLDDALKSRIDTWIRFAVNRRVAHFNLDFMQIDEISKSKYLIPSFLYTHSNLTKVTFANCSVSPPGLVHLPLLRNLSLDEAQFSDAAVSKLLSGCPSLESLKLNFCSGFNDLKICSASLKRLDVSDDGSVPFGSVEISTPKLESFWFLGDWCLCKNQLIIAPSVVNISFCLRWFPSFPNKPSSHRTLRTRIRNLLQSCPKLESFTLLSQFSEEAIAAVNCDIVDAGKAFWRSQEKITCLQHSLKIVEISGFGPSRVGWEFVDPFVEFLLSNALVLEKMDIYVGSIHEASVYSITPLQLFKAAQKMLSYERASSSAVVLFATTNDHD